MNEKMQTLVDAIRSMNVTTKPNVDEIKPIAGFRPTADERDQAWQHIQDNPIDEDIPHATPDTPPEAKETAAAEETADKLANDKTKPQPNPDEQTAKNLWVRTKAGIPTRTRAGHRFTRQWSKVSGQNLSAAQEAFLRADKYLHVSDAEPDKN